MDFIEGKLPDLTGVTIEELMTDPKYAALAEQVVATLGDLPADGVIICSDPFEVE